MIRAACHQDQAHPSLDPVLSLNRLSSPRSMFCTTYLVRIQTQGFSSYPSEGTTRLRWRDKQNEVGGDSTHRKMNEKLDLGLLSREDMSDCRDVQIPSRLIGAHIFRAGEAVGEFLFWEA